jgi:hypothetical protein
LLEILFPVTTPLFSLSKTSMRTPTNQALLGVVLLIVLLSSSVFVMDFMSNTACPNEIRHTYFQGNEMHQQFSECRLVYLDVGSNIGVQVRKLYEPTRYPNAEVLPIFDQYFGRHRNQEKHLCAIGFELNSAHTGRLHALETHYRDHCNYSVRFFTETAATTQNSAIPFWSDGDVSNLEWGSSTNTPFWMRKDRRKSIVQSIDLAEFILRNITPFASTIVMKIDIEGGEYQLLPRLVATGALCDVDFVFLEQHSPDWASSQKDLYQHASALAHSGMSATGCKVRISLLDDESFLHDADGTLNTC